MNFQKLAVIGGDRRMGYAAKKLQEAGFSVTGFGLLEPPHGISEAKSLGDTLAGAELVLLPLPMSRDGVHLSAPALSKPLAVSQLLRLAPLEAQIFGGLTNAFDDPRLLDYGTREELARAGALPTAEGALALAISHLSCIMSGLPTAVLGFGRVGKAVASLFRGAGAHITVFARREETLSVASLLSYGAAHMEELPEYAGDFRCFVNTVPAPVLGDAVLSRMRQDALLLELASPPYGIDLALAEKMGKVSILAPALPGKYAPETAGYAIADTVLAMRRERCHI